jgi:hypothetical protein
MDDDEELPVLGLAERHPPLLGLAMVIIVHRDVQRIAEHRRGELEADLGLRRVLGRLLRIPLEDVDEGISHRRRGP